MKTLTTFLDKKKAFDDRHNSLWWLVLGIITMSLSHLSYSVDLIAWISMVPFLIYLQKTSGWKSKLNFAIALIIAWTVIVLKIITHPIPVFFVFLYSIPIALIHLPGYLVWSKFKNHQLTIFIFPAVLVVLEWIQYTFTPLGSWGAAAYTQLHSPVMQQLLSIFGMAGLGYLIYWINACIAQLLLTKKTTNINFFIPTISLIAVIVFGALRMEFSQMKGENTISVAAVGTNSKVGGLPLPAKEENEMHIDEILKRTARAANFGAEIVVWNEAAFYVLPEDENKWIESFKTLANNSSITVVASYVLLISTEPLQYENKYILINDKGQILQTYLKHEPVPGEPAKKGITPFQTYEVAGSSLGGAICYDYDFPYIAKQYGSQGADIVTIPASDWRGIDPLHTKMAGYRAIEQGHSIVRSTRFGLSAGISPYGEMISSQSSFDNNDKIMMTELPKEGIRTIYSIIGDLFVYGCIIFTLISFIYWQRTLSSKEQATI